MTVEVGIIGIDYGMQSKSHSTALLIFFRYIDCNLYILLFSSGRVHFLWFFFPVKCVLVTISIAKVYVFVAIQNYQWYILGGGGGGEGTTKKQMVFCPRK